MQPLEPRPNPPQHEARRVLLMLADSPTGCAASLMLAHGFMPKLITGLIQAKLVTKMKPMKAGTPPIRATQIRIMDAGHVTLER